MKITQLPRKLETRRAQIKAIGVSPQSTIVGGSSQLTTLCAFLDALLVRTKGGAGWKCFMESQDRKGWFILGRD